MPHFLIKKEEIKKDFVELFDPDTLFHISKVLRAKLGEKIKFIDEKQTLYCCKISEISKKSLKAKILSKEKSQRFLKHKISLIQSVLASDGQNLLIANAVQSGVQEIFPVISDNVSQKVNGEKAKKWQKIALENFKQCERADMAQIREISPLIETILKFKKENVLIFAEKSHNIKMDEALKTLNKSEKIAIVIGPEGGFSEDEFEYFIKNEYKLLSLGSLIYKAPNAVVAAVSNVVSRIEDDI